MRLTLSDLDRLIIMLTHLRPICSILNLELYDWCQQVLQLPKKNAANIQAEQQRKQQEVEEANNMKRQQENYEKQKKNEMESLIRSGTVFVQGNLMWKTHNMDAKSDTDPGIVTYKRDVPEGWRLPTAKEFRNLINSAKETSSGYRYDQYSIPFGTYLINDNGKIKTYNIKLDMVLNDDKGLLRAVKDM